MPSTKIPIRRPVSRLAYRPAELAAMVGLSAKAIYRAIDRGELQASKVANGSRLLIPATSAEEWLTTNSTSPNSHATPTRLRMRRSRPRPLSQALLDNPPAA